MSLHRMYFPWYVSSNPVDQADSLIPTSSHLLYRSRSEQEEVSRNSRGRECRFNLDYRGPAKGYLSALEEEKHQMEALIGTLLASQDHRARTLIQDIVQDPLAREVLSRVDRSIVGTQGRLQGAGRWSERNEASKSGRVGKRMTGEMASSTYEWQDHLLHIIATSPSAAAFRSSSASSSRLLPGPHNTGVSQVQPGYHPSPPEHSVHQREPVHHSHSLHADPGSIHPSLAVRTSHPSLHSAYVGYPQQNPGLQSKPGQGQLQVEVLQPFSISREEVHLGSPRQRRRIENSMAGTLRHVQSAHSLDGRGALSWAGPTHRSHGKPSPQASPWFHHFGLTSCSRGLRSLRQRIICPVPESCCVIL